MTAIRVLAIEDAVLILSNHDGIEGRTGFPNFRQLDIGVLYYIKELAPIGCEQKLVAYSIENIDDAEKSFVELEDNLKFLLADAVCYAGTGAVETGSSLGVKDSSHFIVLLEYFVNVYYSMSHPETSCLWMSPDFTHKC